MQCNQTVRCQLDHNNVEHNFGQDFTELFTDFFFWKFWRNVDIQFFDQFNGDFFSLYTLVE